MSRAPRIIELDALRGIAAISVVLYHYTSRYDRIYGYQGGSPFEFYLGRFGVELFFMISGFVIYMTLSKSRCGWTGIIDFSWSRFARLYPAFWAAMLVTFSIVLIFGLPGRQVNYVDLIANATMLPGIFGVPMVDGVYWTLQREVLFYFWMAIILLLRQLQYMQSVLLGWLLVAIMGNPIASALGVENTVWFKIIKNALILDWIPYFSAGIISYMVFADKRIGKLGLAVLLLAILKVYLDRTSMELIFFLGLLFLFYLLVKGSLRFLARRPLLYLGTISYTLYLIHQNIGYVFIRELLPIVHSPWLAWVLAIASTVAMASILTFMIELPAMKGLRRWKTKWNRKLT